MFKNTYSSTYAAGNKSTSPCVVAIELDRKHKLEFTIGSIIQRKGKEDLLNTDQYTLLNAYVDYKGQKFKEELFDAYSEALENIENLIHSPDFGPKQTLPYWIMNRVFEMYNLEDISYFVNEVFKLEIPSRLEGEFDDQIEKDGKGTREQTYLKSDYADLAAFVIFIKGTYMLLSQYAYVTGDCFKHPNKDAVLFMFYRRYLPIYQSNAMVKLHQFINKLINDPKATQEKKYIRILEKKLSDDEMSELILAQAIFQKLTVATIVTDTSDRNVVNAIYCAVINKLTSKGSIEKTFREKTVLGSEDGEESIIDSHKSMTDVTTGDVVTVNWATSTVERILNQLKNSQYELATKPIEANEKIYTLDDIYQYAESFREYHISAHTLAMLKIMFKGAFDPRYISYLELDSIIALTTVGFAYQWNLGFKHLAMLLMSTHRSGDDYDSLNTTTNKTRLTQEIIGQLEKIYPLSKNGNKTNPDGELVIKRWIEEFGNSYYGIAWTSNLPEDFSIELFKKPTTIVPLMEDLKLQIAKFLIANNDHMYRESLFH